MKNKLISIFIFALTLSGCFSYGDRHEAFIKMGNYYIGETIQSFRKNAPPSVGITQLANGNLEEEWNSYGSCRYFYEFSPVTGIIVAWRFTGSKTDCIRRS